MTKQRGLWLILKSCSQYKRPRSNTVFILLAGLVAGALASAARADSLANVYYSARTDQLVVTMVYRGTNSRHKFTLNWGQCKNLANDGSGELDAEILDSQYQDVETRDFKKTTRFSLADIPCRPATLTLRSAPRFLATVRIPKAVDVKEQ